MKKSILYFILLLTSFAGNGQQINSYLQERAEANVLALVKDKQLAQRVVIDNNGIHLRTPNGRPQYSIYWNEMGHFISNVENSDYYEIQKLFKHKGTQAVQHYSDVIEYNHYTDYPTDLKELSVVLDPGHFGGNLEEALLEGRILRMSATDAKTDQDVSIFEAHLSYVTALLIKQKLAELGCHSVMITRPYGAGALGVSFASWLKEEDGFSSSIARSLKYNDVSRAYYDELILAAKDTTSNLNRNKLFNYYKFLDFRSRIDKANTYRANVTLSLHYNASDNSRPVNSERYYKPTEDNYNMIFIPGGFLYNELDKTDAILDFLRLLVSPDIDNSLTLSGLILEHQTKLTGVPRASIKPESKLYPVSNLTREPGVYARNLPQLRMIRGTVVYGETLLQDNANEAAALSKKEIKLVDPESGKVLWAPRRCDQVAQGYVDGIVSFLEINKEKKLRYTASVKE
ncbi:MAG: hypothetical protein ABJH04_07545 [Cyclobacteriaceae bacterium]